MSGHVESDNPKMPIDREVRGGGKAPYQKPAFRYEQVFETMALACGKIGATQAQCRGNRKAS
jgi:hypothetical protein